MQEKSHALSKNVYYEKQNAAVRLPEKCLRVAILLLRKNGYYEKHFGKKFLIVETNRYYWKRGK